MPVRAVEQGSGGTDFDAVAALGTIQPAAISPDNRVGAPITGFDRFFAHPFIANAGATLAENAALRIVCHHRRKITFGPRVLVFDEAFFEIAPIKSQLLQLALAAAIADGTIERVIRQQKLEHRTLGLLNLFTLRRDHHAIGADDGAGGLQLRHLLDTHQAHATRRLQSKVGVVTERRDVELVLAAHVDQPRAFCDLKVAAVDGYFDRFSTHVFCLEAGYCPPSSGPLERGGGR